MNECFHLAKLDSPKGPFILDEGFQNVSLNNHTRAISQIEENSKAFASVDSENSSIDPLNKRLDFEGNENSYTKVEITTVEDIGESITVLSSQDGGRKLENNCIQQHCIDFAKDESEYGYRNVKNEVENSAQNSQGKRQNDDQITYISEEICQSHEFSSKDSIRKSAEIITPPSVGGIENLSSQAQFMLNLSLNNGNTNESFRSFSVTSKEYELSSNYNQKSIPFDSDLNSSEDTIEMPLTSTPSTPTFEYSAIKGENILLQGQHSLPYGSDNYLAVMPDILEVMTTENRTSKRYESAPDLNRKKISRSPSLRSSCDSQPSSISSSLRSNTDNDLVDTSSLSGILKNLSRDESSSPLLKRKKRKSDIFKDTDCEEEFQSSETEEKSSDVDSKKQYVHQIYDSDDNDDDDHQRSTYAVDSMNWKHNASTVSDFELMMQKKRAERNRGRKRDSTFITSNDELIDQLIERMEEAAYEDRQLNKKGLPATKKVSMLKYVVSQLRKKDLQSIFLEHNILSTLTEWLSPLPSKCLPCLQIRESILRLLDDFPRIDKAVLRQSGIGRVLKFLREHPDETKENQERCSFLIAKWIRPIYDKEYRVMTKKEREERDYALSLKYAKQKKKTPPNSKKLKTNIVDITLASHTNIEASRPGEPGWIPRARVPQPSVRDYIKRPESKLSCEAFTKIQPNRFETLTKKYQKAKRKVSVHSGVKLSIVGEKM